MCVCGGGGGGAEVECFKWAWWRSVVVGRWGGGGGALAFIQIRLLGGGGRPRVWPNTVCLRMFLKIKTQAAPVRDYAIINVLAFWRPPVTLATLLSL